MYNAKSCPSFGNESLIENFTNKYLQSCRDIRSTISQKSVNIAACPSISKSLSEHENDNVPILIDEKSETRQTEKCKDDKIVSSITEKTENDLKVIFSILFFCYRVSLESVSFLIFFYNFFSKKEKKKEIEDIKIIIGNRRKRTRTRILKKLMSSREYSS